MNCEIPPDETFKPISLPCTCISYFPSFLSEIVQHHVFQKGDPLATLPGSLIVEISRLFLDLNYSSACFHGNGCCCVYVHARACVCVMGFMSSLHCIVADDVHTWRRVWQEVSIYIISSPETVEFCSSKVGRPVTELSPASGPVCVSQAEPLIILIISVVVQESSWRTTRTLVWVCFTSEQLDNREKSSTNTRELFWVDMVWGFFSF